MQDLKSANILLARDFTAKIADVGLARILRDDVLSTRREVGTFAWAAPEVLLGQRITEAADIYSVRFAPTPMLILQPVPWALWQSMRTKSHESACSTA